MKNGKKAKKGIGGRKGGGPKKKLVSLSVKSGGLPFPVGRIGRYSQLVGTGGTVYLAAEERGCGRKLNDFYLEHHHKTHTPY
ncbi:histone H2A-like [Cornus florida]|uniref:histone H2A-like n=1 Tax=Cornus florida TaxID=4283 RepID=UPI00289F30A3|nr:histone H2A-like [Cornus florida]